LRATAAKRVVEIGALRGETTELLLGALPPDARLHVIDPLPQFDPSEHERRFEGRYVFHRDTSHAALPDLEAVDVALVDGDHNWFTVYRELELLRETARAAKAALPVLILHDVLWPYGHRDLYYEPDRIPDEFRQPHERRGMRPGEPGLLPVGGVNPTLDNAVSEGGPRNGVMTALDDFVREHDRPIRRVLLPIYFGLTIVADEERLAECPALALELDRLEAADTRLDLLELAESLRLRSVLAEHNAVYGGVARAVRGANRYLGVLKGAILDQQNLENELRLEYLTWCAKTKQDPDPVWLRDPVSKLRAKFDRLQVSRQAGAFPRDAVGVPYYPWTGMGRFRLDHIEKCLDKIRDEGVAGDLVECGVGRGGGSIFMRGFLDAHEIPRKRVWVVDPFLSPETAGPLRVETNQLADLNTVREGFTRFELLDERVRFLQGQPAETLAAASLEQVALARIDCARLDTPMEALEAIYDKVAPAGFVVVDGLDAEGARMALEEFREARGISEPLDRVDAAAVAWRKAEASPDEPVVAAPPAPSPARTKDLSVVVVFYEMRREAERTLQSLSRAFQKGIEDLDYEVIVVENGSGPNQRLDAEFVSGFGEEFRLVDLGSDATPSPAHALNRGIEVAQGNVVALMIDGAHVLSPGVLRFGMLGIRAHSPAMIAVQQWYVGPGQQADAISEGYDQTFEDGLFKRIDWPNDGYRLFEISHFIGYRDWLDGMWESNCIFVERDVLEQIGLVDEAFDMAGGGFANLDLYERIGSTPGLSLVTILGEGSFHQVHGGTTTNAVDPEKRERELAAYRDHYSALRGKSYKGPGKPFHYVGAVRDPAKRTRTRRMGAQAFFGTGAVPEADLKPTSPAPLPEELARQFTEAYWRSFRWQATSWLGRDVERSPADLLAYAQLVAEIEPDWIIETAPGGGRGFFLATICELLGRGEVISLGGAGETPAHPRLRPIASDPLADEVVTGVHDTVGEPANAMLVLGLSEQDDLIAKFNAYSPLVPIGSCAIFEDTIMNGFPIWPGMGPGPSEAVRRINELHPEWVADPALEKITPSFNPGGYLRRTA